MKRIITSAISLSMIFTLSGCYMGDTVNISGEKIPEQKPNQSTAFNPSPAQEADRSQLANELGGNTPQEANQSKQQKPMDTSYSDKYQSAIIKTNQGNIKIKFFAEDSPVTVNNFLKLSEEGFYDQTKFHRVIKDFMIQGGDPNSKDDDWSNDGQGGPGYKFEDEFNSHKLVKGSLAMANSGPNTNGSQFFIVTTDSAPHLDGKHTNFGKVTEGIEIVEKIEDAKTNENDHPEEDVTIENIELIEK
jgi:peptidyl-prolyl cis-trans isomerase B (cyclophilin B)